jgi:predicted GNAT family N-acyltransferase
MILNARENAISFYLSLGYEEVGPYQSDTGIPHKTMKKELVS